MRTKRGSDTLRLTLGWRKVKVRRRVGVRGLLPKVHLPHRAAGAFFLDCVSLVPDSKVLFLLFVGIFALCEPVTRARARHVRFCIHRICCIQKRVHVHIRLRKWDNYL